MKMKSMILLAVAVGCGLVAMLGVQQVLSGRKTVVDQDQTPVLVATADIAPGIKLDETNTRFEKWPSNLVAEGMVTDVAQIDDRSLRIAAVAHDIIMLTKMNAKGVHGASSEIPAGMRIITVPVNLTKSHSGLIMPGDRVDVIVTYKTVQGGRRNVAKTKTLLEYIRVFAADNLRQSGANSSETTEYDAKNMSLLVTPDQYNMCVQAQQMGTLSLALRRKDDDAIAEAGEYDEELLGVARSSFAKAEPTEEEPISSSGDVRDFLEQQNNGQAQAAVKNDPLKKLEVGPPKWTIKIYAGHEVREAKVDLPEAAKGDGKPASVLGPEADKNKTTKPGWLKGIFNGA